MTYMPDITQRYPEGFGMPSRDMSEADLIGYDDIPYEVEGDDIPKRFAVGQEYMWTDWFTGGQSWYTVKEITNNKVVFSEYRREIDGEYEMEEKYDICTDESGNEYLVMCCYRGEEGRLYAERG